MTTERYDELVQEAVFALRIDVCNFITENHPDEAEAFEAKLNELADMENDREF